MPRLPANDPPAPARDAAPRRPAFWLAVIGAVAVPLLLAVLLFRWQAHQQTTGGRTALEWSQQLLSVQPAERQAAEAALRTLGTNAVPPLARALLQPEPRWQTLGQRLARRAPNTWRQWLYQNWLEPDPNTARMAAARGLAVLGPVAASALPQLVAGLGSPNPTIAWQASQAVVGCGTDAVPLLIPVLATGEPAARLQAAWALGQIGPRASPAVPALVAALDTTNRSLRYSAMQALTRIWTNPAASFSNVFLTLRGPAREAAAEVGTHQTFPPRTLQPGLVEMLRDPVPSTRLVAVRTLGELTFWTREAFVGMQRASADAHPEVRALATTVLTGADARPRTPPWVLAEVLADPAGEFRVEAAQALGRLGSAAAPVVGTLEAALTDPNPAVRAAARAALASVTNAPPP